MIKKYAIANWKMNLSLNDITKWLNNFQYTGNVKVLLAPSYPYLGLIDHTRCSAQNVSVKEQGSHTGETGIFQIKDFCTHCIIGHSERKESKKIVLEKRDLCLNNGVTPIVCLSNPEESYDYYRSGTLLAWEDPKNISVGGVLNQIDINEIKNVIYKMKKALPEEAVLIYGGSVNRQNIPALNNTTLIDGVLVGGASLDPQHFMDIIKVLEK